MEVGRAYEDQAGASLNATSGTRPERAERSRRRIKSTVRRSPRRLGAKSLARFPNQQAKDADGRGMPGTDVMNAYIKAVADTGYSMPVDYVIE